MPNVVRIILRADDDTEPTFALLRRRIRQLDRRVRSDFRDLGRDAGRAFGSALDGNIGSALSTIGKNPYLLSAVLGLAVALADLLGAALGGLLVLAIGSAFVGLGAYLAFQAKDVQKAWKRTAQNIKNDFKDVGKPLEPVLKHAFLELEKLSDAFAPHLKDALTKSAPHVQTFIDTVARSIKDFGKTAFHPLMDSFDVLLDAFGPEWEGFIEDLAGAFKYLADGVKENAPEVALAIRFILEIITGIIYAIGYLVRDWGRFVRLVKDTRDALKDAWAWLNKMSGKTLHFAAEGLAWIVDKLEEGWNWIQRLTGKRLSFYADGLKWIVDKVIEGWRWITNLKGKTLTFRAPGLSWIIDRARDLVGWLGSISRHISISFSAPGLSSILPFLATGGISGARGVMGGGRQIGHAATGGVRGNLTVVGERGPELVDLAPGSRVRSNNASRAMLAGGGAGAPTVIEIRSGGSALDDLLVEMLRRAIRIRGGNVQLILGRN